MSIQETSRNRSWQGNDPHLRRLGERCHHSRNGSGWMCEEWVKKESTASWYQAARNGCIAASLPSSWRTRKKRRMMPRSLRIVDFDEKAVSIDKLKCYHRRNRGGRAWDRKEGRPDEIHLQAFINDLSNKPKVLEDYDEDVWSYLIDKAIVNRDGSITFIFRNGKGKM